MSSRKRGQAGRPQRELKMVIIHVTIQIGYDMSSRKRGQSGREGPRG